jgi:hypothetical protein
MEDSQSTSTGSVPELHRTVGGFPAVPTTKVLAIGRLLAPLTPEQRKHLMPAEVPDTVRLFLSGKVDQWWSRQDGEGPVFLMNATSVAEARAALSTLPLVHAKLVKFDLLELGPLRPLHLLVSDQRPLASR